MITSPFAALNFPVNRSHGAITVERVAALASDFPSPSILDLGCGDGAHTLALARALPASRVVGIDVSPSNIAAAKAACAAAEPVVARRVEFRTGDFMAMSPQPYDFIHTTSVLHLIDVSTEVMAERLAAMLVKHGWLVASIPFDCVYNRLLFAARRLARRVGGQWIDEVALRLGRRLHAGFDDAFLRSRLPYCYVLPHRIEGAALRRTFAGHGLVLRSREPLPHTSSIQPKHCLAIYRLESRGAT